ncbi:hypothetical protein DVH24_042476 [Malus domestica]|uniref:KIB1-4 beta-propeller domain-containing protein n=1 Tax=Malus domestica TaxID=3750 RepID=A0A498HE31_MALDO|nr:hypothetical protein DVH24_042476 [Malus domestica]
MTSLLGSVADGWTRPIDTNSLTMMDQEWSITMVVISLLNPNYKPKQETCLIADPWHKVMLGKTFSYTEPPKTKGFRVFKLECDIDAGPQWMEVVELGGRVLFVSNHHSAVYCTLWSKGRKKNNIYFDFDYSCYDSTGCNYEIFSFTNKSIRHFSCPKSRSWSQLYTTSLWFVPNL